MRWDNLFDDLESQLELELGAEDLDLVAEEERLRLGRLALRDRLVALVGHTEPLHLVLRDGESVALRLSAAGRDWIAGDLHAAGSERTAAVVPIAAISSLLPTAEQLLRSIRADFPVEPATSLSARLGLTFVLRDLCRRRSGADLVTGGIRTHGTIDRVGRDQLDLAEHEPGVPRRDAAVTRIRIVPLSELLLIRF
jgi:hypothetical protein